MKKHVLFWMSWLALAGCLDTREDIRAQEEKKVLATQVTTLQRSTADQMAHYQEVQDQLRALNGRIEVLESQMAQLSTRQQNSDGEREKQHADTDEKIKLMTETIATLQTQVAALDQQAQAAQAAVQQQEEQAKANKESAPAADKSQWTAGNKEFEAKNWKKAIVVYEKYRSGNPKGKHYAEATYKIGVSFQELGMKQEARAFYEEVVAKYPKGEEAKKAALRLKQVK